MGIKMHDYVDYRSCGVCKVQIITSVNSVKEEILAEIHNLRIDMEVTKARTTRKWLVIGSIFGSVACMILSALLNYMLR